MTLASFAVVFAGYRPDRLHEGSGGAQLNNGFPTTWKGIWEGSVWNWGIISTALFKVFYSYAGLENVNNVLNEVKDPVRTLKSAAPTALVTACLLYFVVNVAYFLIVPLDEIKKGGEMVAALFFQRVFGPTTGNILLPLAVAVSAAGNVMVVTFALVRFAQKVCFPHEGTQLTVFLSTAGSTKSGDRTTRRHTLWRNSLLFSAIWRTSWWIDDSLDPLRHRDLHPKEEHLLLYSRCRRISRTILRACHLARPYLAETDKT